MINIQKRKIFVVFLSLLRGRFQIIVWSIIVLACFLRVIGLREAMWSNVGYDETRDTLVVSHIVEYGERPIRGPNSSHALLAYPPTYYYFLSILWYLVRSVYGLKLAWMILSVLGVYIAYKVGSQLYDRPLGTFFAVLLAIHPIFIITGQQISPPYLLPVIILSIALFLMSPPTATTLSLSIVLLLFGVHVHYSMLLVVPVVGLWIAAQYLSFWKKQIGWVRIAPCIWGLLMFVIWLLFSYRYSPMDQIDFFTKNPTTPVLFEKQAIEVLRQWVMLITYHDLDSLETGPLLFLIGLYALCGIAVIRLFRHSRGNYPAILATLGLCSIPLFLAARYTGTMTNAYLMVALPFMMLMIACVIRFIYRHSKPAAVMLFVMILAYLLSYQKELWPTTRSARYYKQMNELARRIQADQSKISTSKVYANNRSGFSIYFLTPVLEAGKDIWQTGGIWFHLEHLMNARLIFLTNDGTSFLPLANDPAHVYLVCDSRIFDTYARSGQRTCDSERMKIETVSGPSDWVYTDPPYSLWRIESSPNAE